MAASRRLRRAGHARDRPARERGAHDHRRRVA